MSSAPLQTASKPELLARIRDQAGSIRTLNATVDIATSVGGEKKGKITQYEEIRGYILLRKPKMLRMIGLFPLVRNKAFDMVSNGNQFRLSIPARNRFYVGHDRIIHPSTNSLENLRPQVIYDALLLPDIDPESDIAVLEDSTEAIYDPKRKKNLEQPDYVIDVIHHVGTDWFLGHKVIFDRTNLVPHQQIIYDQNGRIATEVTYQVYQDYNGISFPHVIEISRPLEEYSIRLTVVKLAINEPLRDDQFALQQPPGSQLVNLDEASQTASSTAPNSPAESGNSPQKK